MRWPNLLMFLFLSALRPVAAYEPESVLLDKTVRYVNDSVISVGDIWLRNERRRSELVKNHGSLPSEALSVGFAQETLEELTDEELLIQEAKRISETYKMHPVNHDQVMRSVQEDASRSGRTMTLREQADLCRDRERQETIQFILGAWFYQRTAYVTEAEIAAAYQARMAKYSRPARIQALEIVLRATDAAEREQLAQLKRRLFKDAQDQNDAALKKTVESRLDAFFAASAADQEKLLDEVVRELAGFAERTDLDRKGRELTASAKAALVQLAAFRDLDGAKRQLTELRANLINKKTADAEAEFKATAQRISQGPNAVQGGDLGWLEPGVYTPIFDEQAFACRAGDLSQVFTVDQAACLVLVTAREEARVRPLDEVRGELDAVLTRERRDEVKRNAVAMLRSKASIRDLSPLTDRKVMEILALPMPR